MSFTGTLYLVNRCTFAIRQRLRPVTGRLANGFRGSPADRVTGRTRKRRPAADLPAHDGHAENAIAGHVRDVRTEDALAEGDGRIPAAGRQARELRRADQRVAVEAGELRLGAHLGVLRGHGEALALGHRRAVDRVHDDLDAVLVARGRDARERARVVLLGVQDAQAVLEVPVADLVLRPAFRVFPVRRHGIGLLYRRKKSGSLNDARLSFFFGPTVYHNKQAPRSQAFIFFYEKDYLRTVNDVFVQSAR